MLRVAAVLCAAALVAGKGLRAPRALKDDYYTDDLDVVEGGYNPATALQMAHAASAAYCGASVLQSWSCGPDCSAISTDGRTLVSDYAPYNLQAYVTELGDGSALLAFRGTLPTSLKNWIENLNITRPAPYANCNGCEVEGGFLNGWRSLEPSIKANLAQLGFGPGSPIHVTGHSLGASMATLAAFELANAGWDVQTQYTFGQPRVGNEGFSKVFSSTVQQYRVTHYHDIVPHLPLEAMGFYHTTTEIWYNEPSTSYTTCVGGEDDSCADGVPFWDWSVNDHLHYMGIYVDGHYCTEPSLEATPGAFPTAA